MSDSPLSVSQLGQYLNGSQSVAPISMVQATPQTALQGQFMQTPGYQLQYGNNNQMDPTQRFMNSSQYQLAYGNNMSMDPSERFRNDAGTQLAIQAGMAPLTNQYAAKGLGNSGALAQALSNYQYNNYGNFINNQENMLNSYQSGQNNMFQNYQSQLANLAQFGAGQTGGAQSLQNGQTAAGILGPANISTGQNIGQANLGVGENIAQLLANQGVYGGNAYLGTGAALANNTMQGMQLAAQVSANNNASNASYMGGQGALQGAQSASNPYQLTGGSSF